jgi:hypothetical protein
MGANDFEGSDGGPLPGQVVCPHCNGRGGGEAFINRGPDISTHSREWVDCMQCSGAKYVDADVVRRIEKGQAMRDARVARKQSLLEASQRMGISSAELSAIEHGRGPAWVYLNS